MDKMVRLALHSLFNAVGQRVFRSWCVANVYGKKERKKEKRDGEAKEEAKNKKWWEK
jgi:hypothetical protein